MTTAGSGIRVQKARKPGSGRPMWLVLGEDCLPIQPVDEFLTFHDVTGSSPNTIRSYAHHLKLYWKYLTEAELDWRAATLQHVIDFVAWLRWGSPPDSASRKGHSQRLVQVLPSDGPAATESDSPPAAPEQGSRAADLRKVAASSIRVPVNTLDHLMTMVSELVLTRNQLIEIVRRHQESEFKTPLQRLSNVTAQL